MSFLPFVLLLMQGTYYIRVSFLFCLSNNTYTNRPRFSFQLAISPSQAINNEPHSVSVESQMALKVEGVICHGKDPQVFRKIKFVKLLVEISSEERRESTDVKVLDFGLERV